MQSFLSQKYNLVCLHQCQSFYFGLKKFIESQSFVIKIDFQPIKKMEKLIQKRIDQILGIIVSLPTQSIVQSNPWLMAQKVNEHLG